MALFSQLQTRYVGLPQPYSKNKKIYEGVHFKLPEVIANSGQTEMGPQLQQVMVQKVQHQQQQHHQHQQQFQQQHMQVHQHHMQLQQQKRRMDKSITHTDNNENMASENPYFKRMQRLKMLEESLKNARKKVEDPKLDVLDGPVHAQHNPDASILQSHHRSSTWIDTGAENAGNGSSYPNPKMPLQEMVLQNGFKPKEMQFTFDINQELKKVDQSRQELEKMQKFYGLLEKSGSNGKRDDNGEMNGLNRYQRSQLTESRSGVKQSDELMDKENAGTHAAAPKTQYTFRVDAPKQDTYVKILNDFNNLNRDSYLTKSASNVSNGYKEETTEQKRSSYGYNLQALTLRSQKIQNGNGESKNTNSMHQLRGASNGTQNSSKVLRSTKKSDSSLDIKYKRSSWYGTEVPQSPKTEDEDDVFVEEEVKAITLDSKYPQHVGKRLSSTDRVEQTVEVSPARPHIFVEERRTVSMSETVEKKKKTAYNQRDGLLTTHSLVNRVHQNSSRHSMTYGQGMNFQALRFLYEGRKLYAGKFSPQDHEYNGCSSHGHSDMHKNGWRDSVQNGGTLENGYKRPVMANVPMRSISFNAPRQKQSREPAPWERPAQEGVAEGVVEEPQRGRIPLLRQSVDRDTTPEKNGQRRFRERAPWEKERPEDEVDSACSSDAEFDEHHFLRGKLPSAMRRASQDGEQPAQNGGGRFNNNASKKFTMLRRSMSRDRSPSRESDSSGYTSINHNQEENQDPDKVIRKLSYKGGNIPSKTFMRLQKRVNKMNPPTAEELHAERMRANSKENLDVDEAIEKMNIQSNEPDQYLQQLKKTMEEQDVKIEPEPEITDF